MHVCIGCMYVFTVCMYVCMYDYDYPMILMADRVTRAFTPATARALPRPAPLRCMYVCMCVYVCMYVQMNGCINIFICVKGRIFFKEFYDICMYECIL